MPQQPETSETENSVQDLQEELPAVCQPILVPEVTDSPGVWNQNGHSYTDYINSQDRRLQAALDAGFNVSVLLLKPNVFASWCAAASLPQFLKMQ